MCQFSPQLSSVKLRELKLQIADGIMKLDFVVVQRKTLRKWIWTYVCNEVEQDSAGGVSS